MNKNKKILLTALVIIIIGAFSFNYVNTIGKVVNKGATIITISPKDISANDYIYIYIQPGKQGVYQDIEFYRDSDKRLTYQADVCRSSKCFEKTTVEYKIVDSWDNNDKWDYTENSRDYYVRVYDIYSGKYVRTYFTVERFYEAEKGAVS